MEGWLFDLYPAPEGGVVAWLITRDGRAIRLYDSWHPSIYAWASSPTELNRLLTQHDLSEVEMAIDYKYVSPGDFDRSKVLRLTFKRGRDIAAFLRSIGPRSLINIRLFNVDIPLAQLYLYEKDLFPLAYVRTYPANRTIKWELLDDATLCRYETPPLRGATLALTVKKTGRIPSLNDPLESIRVKTRGIVTEIEGGSETDKLLDFVELIQEIDPDVILTENGDSFVFPYLIQRASRNQILPRMILDREGRPLRSPRQGRSYFSYGRIYYKPSPTRLLGRLHLDSCNDFIFEDCGLQGLFEIARTCRTPLHRASRETIGTNMTSLQMYQALRRGILIPWKKNEPENFKSAWELLKADRGGFILEPKIGLFDAVGEIDFASLYPTLMMKHNLTPECISCRCCTNGMKVPELNYGLCEKMVGIVPHTLQILLHKRAQYKSLMNHPIDPNTRKIYDQRQGALKWTLVCSFGYLGYKNARFGKIDAHISVCAFARHVLRETIKIAQRNGFSVVHGIVDSVWLKKKGATEVDYVDLCGTIEKELGLPISFEGIYRWIVFLPSKVHTQLPVLNRYYGVFKHGEIKMRGIEYRRRDTPEIIKQCQRDMINHLATAHDRTEFLARLPGVLQLIRRYVDKLENRCVDLRDLLITKQLSKNPTEYRNNVAQAVAARQLVHEGRPISAGQNVSYVLQKQYGWSESKVAPSELLDASIQYDVQKYTQLLLDSAVSLLSPLGYDKQTLLRELRS